MKLKHTIKIDDNVSMDFLLEEVCTKEEIINLMSFLKNFIRTEEKTIEKIIYKKQHERKYSITSEGVTQKYTDIKNLMKSEDISFNKAYKQICGSFPGTDSAKIAKERFNIDISIKRQEFVPRKHLGYKLFRDNAEKIRAYMEKNNCMAVQACTDMFGYRPSPSDYTSLHKYNLIGPAPKRLLLNPKDGLTTEEKYRKVEDEMKNKNLSFTRAYINIYGNKPGGGNRRTAEKYGIDVCLHRKPNNKFGAKFIREHEQDIKNHMHKTGDTICDTCFKLFGKKPRPSDYSAFHHCGII